MSGWMRMAIAFLPVIFAKPLDFIGGNIYNIYVADNPCNFVIHG